MKREDYEIALSRASQFYESSGYKRSYLSYYVHADPILQKGPCCGLVALAMAADALKRLVSVNDLYETAKVLKFTVCGEMFSAANMATLASHVLHCHANVICDLKSQENLIVEHLLSGFPVLIPYDADRNHVPCCKRGHFAHWALITGVCFILCEGGQTEPNVKEPSIYHFSEGNAMRRFMKDSEKILVYARHGKSQHLAVWSLEELLQSNRNLLEIHSKHNVSQMVVPSTDVLGGLRDKAVLLSP